MMPSRRSRGGVAVSWLRTVAFLARIALGRRYAGTVMGIGWSLLNPAAQLAVYGFAFGHVMRVPIDNYFIYLIAGLLPWSMMQAGLTVGAGALLGRSAILNSSTLPASTFILADVAVEVLSFAIAFMLLMLVALALDQNNHAVLLLVPVVLLPLLIVTVSGGVVLAFLSVLYRDIPYLLGIGLNIMFWLTPVVYHWSMVPSAVALFVQYNPLAVLIGPIQVVVHGREVPSLEVMLWGYGMALAAVGVAVLTARRLAPTIIYRL